MRSVDFVSLAVSDERALPNLETPVLPGAYSSTVRLMQGLANTASRRRGDLDYEAWGVNRRLC